MLVEYLLLQLLAHALLLLKFDQVQLPCDQVRPESSRYGPALLGVRHRHEKLRP